jgi:rRNA maturation endonuclease Nob1
MASWVLRCVGCKRSFIHSPIVDKRLSDYLSPRKPDFPADGSEMKCPNCGHTALYQRTDLTYQA